LIKLENGATCTCDSEGGCAYHGMGPAGVYRKGFEHASANYNAEKARADQAEHETKRAIARYQSAEEDLDRFIRENSALKDEIGELRAALRAMASLVTEAEAKMRAQRLR